ncbi:glycosyltransferase family 39 protein [Roseimicrobium sp. ORNL1]|uniref:ArnT family glycosyltransferase n=1 Tax=Roseimicrobium sp. ORNL1 TaxID=2711231 RepID=UPI0013E15085|nr:glycosyltransferase family 39 protein [Roseimicrobium sp. ORNL1]QIE99977.1 glycosyltransferase family 39 protein [Roseimicrobium sp. ORNL1]
MSAESPAPGRRFSWWHLLAVIFLLRLLYLPLFCSVTDLAGDESYYWEWGRRPDWGYYSKPPMIGWLMGVTGLCTGHAEWGVRLAALLMGTGTLACLALLARRMFGERAAWLTILLAALTPANAALNLFFTIDAPLLLCWSAALLAFWNCVDQPERTRHWVFLTLALGLGNLSKQMMLVFPVITLLFLSLESTKRFLLRRPALWVSLAISLLFLAPVLIWQAQHHWITLEHTKEHFHGTGQHGIGKWLVQVLSFPAAQALLFSPVTWALMIFLTLGGLWKWKVLELRQRYLVIFSGPALVVFFLLALRQNINPNWPAAFHLSAIVLVAGSAHDMAAAAWAWGRIRGKSITWALRVGAVLCLLAYLLPLYSAVAKYAKWEVADPMRRLRGWKESGEQAGAMLARVPRPGQTFLLALGHRENASQFAFYTPQHPKAYRWQSDGKVASQYEIWPSAGAEQQGNDALILQPSDKPLPKSLTNVFTSVEPLGMIDVPLGKGESRKWQVYLGRELKGWME